MIDGNELARLQRKNRKLKNKIWNDYRNFSDELRMLKHQKKSLQNSIQIEQNKNRELIQHFTNKISQLQEQLRQVSAYTPPVSPNYSFPAKQKKKVNFKWRFQELEEEGKALRLDTEKAFKKCREASSLNLYFTDIPPPVSNYAFDYPPIVISSPQSIGNRNEHYYMNDEDNLYSSSSSSSIPNDIQISPIVVSQKRNKKSKKIKQKENNSNNSSTVSVKQESFKYGINSDSNSIDESSSVNDGYDNPPLESLKPTNNNLFSQDQYNVNNKQSMAIANAKTNEKPLVTLDSTSDQTKITQSNQKAKFTPPNIEIPQNKQPIENSAKQPLPQTSNIKNSQLSPIHIKTHLDDESEQSIDQPNIDTYEPITIQQPKQQSEVQIVKPVVQPNTNTTMGFVSQSNWETDDDDNNEIIFDPEVIADVEKDEIENKKNNLSGGIPSDTNPILDTSDNKSSVQQKQENSPPPEITKVATTTKPPGASPTESLDSKVDFNFSIEIDNDDNFW